MDDLKRIAAINDISGLGKCSLTVALPVISAAGVECSCLPTALLSTHTGGFEGYTFRDLSEDMLSIARHWRSVGAEFDGIYSGYLASADQAETLEQALDILVTERTKVLVDPVMADNGQYYVNHGEEMCQAFRRLCSRADVITPNVTEAAFLAGIQYEPGPHSQKYIDSLVDGLTRFCNGYISITGVRPTNDSIGAVSVNTCTGERYQAVHPMRSGVFHGAGDIYASAFSALLIRGAELKDATTLAIDLVGDSIARTEKRGTPRRNGVDFESALFSFVSKVQELFGS